MILKLAFFVRDLGAMTTGLAGLCNGFFFFYAQKAP
jgi:hypothetical protein